MLTPLALSGGVDLMTVVPTTKPGSLRDCLNFEIGERDGYTRIDGVVRFDGQPGVANYKLWRLKFATDGTVFNPGDEVYFDTDERGYVLNVYAGSPDTTLYVVFAESAQAPALPMALTNATVAGSASITSRDVVFALHGTQDTFDTALSALYTVEREKITQVPGRINSDIIGLFFFKDRCYAIRDLMRVSFSGGYYTDANEGQYVTYNGSVYKILNVRQTGVQAGVITLDPVAGGVDNATPLTAATLDEIVVTGDIGDGYIGIPYSDSLSATGVPPYTWALAGSEAGTTVDLSSVDLSAITFLPQITDAAIYRSTPTGWERVPLGREMKFRSGNSDLANFDRALSVDGYDDSILNKFPTDSTFNGAAATGPNADDGSETALTGASGDEFILKGFDFDALPDNAIITGIEVIVERHSDTATAARDHLVDLLVENGGTDNKAKTLPWPNAIAATTYGSPTDLWGSQSITPAQIKDDSFGVRILVERADSATACVGGLDYVKVNVYFRQQDVPIYLWDGTTDVEATLRHIQFTAGDTSDGSAEGWMTIDADDNATKPRLVGEGDEIRTAPSGGGDLLALVAARDKPMWPSGQSEIDNNRSRYKFVKANFYGQDEFDAIYGVSGAGPAFSFDGVRYIRIHAPLPQNLDLPRHIMKHGDCLALGFYAGACLFSAVGDPYELRGSDGATAIEIGDRMVGMRSLSGDAMVVIGQETTHAIRGTTADTFFKSVISANRGGIEYTDADMGRVVLCDGQGLFAADSAEQFGAAQRNYLSVPILPWLRPRLQATINSEQAYIRPIAALNVRSKNQYRLYFWDGYVLTMTNKEPCEFTFQRMYEPGADEHTEPTPWRVRALASGIDGSGRERLFVSFYGAVKEGYVFEMDAGRSFDGDPIPSFIELNPLDLRNASGLKRADRVFTYGVGSGKATLRVSRSANDESPDPTIYDQMVMGRDEALARQAQPFKGSADLGIEGDDVALRFDHNSATEASFTLQFLNPYFDSRGQGRGTAR